MIFLDATTKKIQVVLEGAVSSQQPYVSASYAFITTTTFVLESTSITTNNTTAQDLIAAPPASNQIRVFNISVYNSDNAAVTVVIRMDISGTVYVLMRAVLEVGDNLIYEDAEGWQVIDSNGYLKISLNPLSTADIANDSITFAKMQNIPTDSLIGRDTAGTGDPETILLNATLSMDGSGNIQRAALTGDVTASAGSNALTIANDAVTNTKAANMADSTIKGRTAGAGTGDPVDLTAAQAKTILAIASTDVSDFTEAAQDAVGAMIADTPTIDLAYADATPALTASVIVDSIDNTFLANMAQSTIKGRAASAGTGDPTDLTPAQLLVMLVVPEGLTANRTYYVRVSLGTVTMTIASPCVVTLTAHGLSTNDPIVFTTTGALPTGLTAGTVYFANVINANTFNVAATVGGANINTTGSQSGTHTIATGNDTNTGLAQTRSAALLTLQAAIDLISSSLDLGIYDVTIQVANGLCVQATAGNVLKNCRGAGKVIIQGDTTTPANVVISTITTADLITFSASAVKTIYNIQGFKLITTCSGTPHAIYAELGSTIQFKNIEFSTGFYFQIWTVYGALIRAIGNYTISGGAAFSHATASRNAQIDLNPFTVTLTGTPAFPGGFVYATSMGYFLCAGVVFSGAATGPHYQIQSGALVLTQFTGVGAEADLPGNSLGLVSGGGRYNTFINLARNSAQFDKANTTLADITGLSISVLAGRTYKFRAILFTTSSAASGVKAAIAGTATATSIRYEGWTMAASALGGQTRATALATAVAAITAVTAAMIFIEGMITVNAAGTLTVQFADNTGTNTSSVLTGSSFEVEDITQ